MGQYPSLTVRLWRAAPWSRNPLTRASDRVDGAVRVLAALLVLIAVPIALAAATAEYSSAAERIRSENATKAPVTASIATEPSPVPSDGRVPPARLEAQVWWSRDGQPGEATTTVPGTARVGDRIQLWLGPDGLPTTQPQPTGTAALRGVVMGLLILTYGCGGAIGLVWITGYLLRCRNSREWAREWRRLGPAFGRDMH
ncbi:hypothetical protein BJY24_000048 [Nocardia transvalensis]|uniref:Uncharacterized protein n=1 Tax=Nocardia transvalensis TaxID=37333 RepID=A0A7W9P815_9NOCA|nr:hypothetical protein [Nocardia transvalensis]MBB5911181.1 hypothetical protein [Nocardia transvalensis]